METGTHLIKKLGDAFLLVILLLPLAAVMMHLGILWDLPLFKNYGDTIYRHLPLFYAMAVTKGFSDKPSGTAVFSAATGYIIFEAACSSVHPGNDPYILGGIIAGAVCVTLYNRLHYVHFKGAFEILNSERGIPLISSIVLFFSGLIVGFIWPVTNAAIESVGHWITQSGPFGTFVYGTLNRLLLPLGLHHNLNAYLWYDYGIFNTVTGDMHRYFAGDPSAGIYMAGFYPIMMFGLPAVIIAFYRSCPRSNRRYILGLYLGGAAISFLTGITEPVELMFMFLLPHLYILHCLFTGLSCAVAQLLNIHIGFKFSAGFIDFIPYVNDHPNSWRLLGMGVITGAIYYVVFRQAMKWSGLNVPGDYLESENRQKEFARSFVTSINEALGGLDNIRYVLAMFTRFEIGIHDIHLVDQEALSQLKTINFIIINDNTYQIITGNQGRYLKEAVREIYSEKCI